MINIAVDQCIGNKKIKKLQKMGYNIVCRAKKAESDDSWMQRAFLNGAKFAISADMDIPNIIERERYPIVWIDYPHHNKDLRDHMISYVDSKIKFKLYLFRKFSKEFAF